MTSGSNNTNAESLDARSQGDFVPFIFSHGTYCLHVPTSSVVAVPASLGQALVSDKSQSSWTPEQRQLLAGLKAAVPATPAKPESVKPDINTIAMNVAQSCNLRCTYCFAGDGDYGKLSMMDETTARRTIQFFASGKPRLHVIFFGGEPLLNFSLIEQVVEFSKTFADTKFTWSITTNGTLLSSRHLEFFHQNGVIVNISWDGKGVQSSQRPMGPSKSQPQGEVDTKGTSEQILMRKLERFQTELSALKAVQLRSTAMKNNLDNFEEGMIHTLTAWNYKFLMGYQATSDKKFAFGPEDVKRLGGIYERVVDRFASAGEFDRILRLEPMRSHLVKIKRAKKHQIFCLAGIHYLSVSSTGKFYLCHRFTEDSEECVGDLDSGINHSRLERYSTHRLVQHEPCNSCWMREWCGGGCFHENKAAGGTPFRPDPMFCLLQDLEIRIAMRVYTLLVSRNASQLKDL